LISIIEICDSCYLKMVNIQIFLGQIYKPIMEKKHHEILIIGGGTGGIMTAVQLLQKSKQLDVAIIEPADTHIYQAAWTLVGAGEFDLNKTKRPMSRYIPKGVTWIKDKVIELNPEESNITTQASGSFSYDYLVVSPGLVMKPEWLPGLPEALASGVASSLYTDPEFVWQSIRNFKGGNALFSQPGTPIKCGGAPQKIMYLAEDYFRKSGIRQKTNVIFATPGTKIFGVKEFGDTLNKVIEERDIIFKPFYKPVSIQVDERTVTFEFIKRGVNLIDVDPDQRIGESYKLDEDGKQFITIGFGFLHIAPPQAAPDFIRNSGLSYVDGPNKGWAEVDIHTLQHVRYANVFCIGDVAALPTAKTGAAIRKQVPVVVANILSLINKGVITDESYDGYSSCPIVTKYGAMLLAEFKYNNERASDPFISRFVDTTKEQYSMWLLKKYGLPFLYWNFMMKGRM
jgi:sulfide:quinone oxidoreductase